MTPEEYSRWFNDTVNQAIGPKTGRVINSRPARPYTNETQKPFIDSISRLKAFDFKAPSSSSSSSGGSSSGNIDLMRNPATYDDAQEIEAAIKELEGGEKLPFIPDPVKSVSKDIFTRGVDVISRPLYGLYNSALEGEKALDRGENPWDALDDTLKGAWKGISGEEKTTPGQYAEYMTDPDVERNRTTAGKVTDFLSRPFNPVGPVIEGNRELRKEYGRDNLVSQNINRGLGIIGEVTDPANAVGLGVVSKGLKGSQAGARLTAASRGTIVREASESALKKSGLDNVKRSSLGPGSRVFRATNSADYIPEEAADMMDRLVLDPQGQVVQMNIGANRTAVVESASAELLQNSLVTVNKYADQLATGTIDYGTPRWKNLAKRNKEVGELDSEIRTRLVPGKSLDEAIEEAAEAIRDRKARQVDDFAAEFNEELLGATYNSPTLRIGGRTGRQFEIPYVGQAYAAVKRKNPSFGAPKAVSINKVLPGRYGQVVRNARGSGHRGYDQFKGRIRGVARKYNKTDRKEISRILNEGTSVSPGDHLYDGVMAIRNEYKDMLKAEVMAGVRTLKDKALDNYQYVHIKDELRGLGEKQKLKKKEFSKGRRADASAGRSTKLTPEEAVRRGMRAVDDPFENLAYRKLKSQRMMADAQVKEAFIREFGLSARGISPALAKARGWRKITNNTKPVGYQGSKVPDSLQARIIKSGEEFYLPEDVARMFDNYNHLANPRNAADLENLRDYLKIYDKLLNFFKVSATLPYPGFHVKNMAGDIFLGFLDGVGPKAYTDFINGAARNQIDLGDGVTIGKKDFDDLYQRHAGSAGFNENEFFPGTKVGTRNRLRQGGQILRDRSEWREDFVRRVHFQHALRQEMKRSKVKWTGMGTMDTQAFRNAANNATFRVDKFKFDYGALTSFERNVLKRMVPFYTFARKSAPVMLEGMLTNPALFAVAGRFFNSDVGPAAPNWMREMGYAAFGDENNPLLLPQNFLPYDQLMDWGSDPSLGGGIKTLVGQLAPPLKTPIEVATNQDMFSGRPIGADGQKPSTMEILEYTAGKMLPQVGTANQLRRDGVGGTDFFLGNRLALGTGVKRLEQEDQIRNWQQHLNYYGRELEKLSQKGAPFGVKIYISRRKTGTSVIVKSTVDNQKFFEGTLADSLKFFNDYIKKANPISELDEPVDYVDQQGVLQEGTRRDVSPLDRILGE